MAVDLRKLSTKALKWSIRNLEYSLNGFKPESLSRLDIANVKVVSKDRVTADIIIRKVGHMEAECVKGLYEYRGNSLTKVDSGPTKTERDAKNVWLHGIEHLTKDLNGYVYWRTMPVERFNFRDADGGIEREKAEAEKLAGVCMWIEEKGMKVNHENIMNEQKAAAMYEDLAQGFGCARRVG